MSKVIDGEGHEWRVASVHYGAGMNAEHPFEGIEIERVSADGVSFKLYLQYTYQERTPLHDKAERAALGIPEPKTVGDLLRHLHKERGEA